MLDEDVLKEMERVYEPGRNSSSLILCRVLWDDAIAACAGSSDVRTRGIGVIASHRRNWWSSSAKRTRELDQLCSDDPEYWGAWFWYGVSACEVDTMFKGVEMREPDACVGMWMLVAHRMRWTHTIGDGTVYCIGDICKCILCACVNDAEMWVWVGRMLFMHTYEHVNRSIVMDDGRTIDMWTALEEALRLDADCMMAYEAIINIADNVGWQRFQGRAREICVRYMQSVECEDDPEKVAWNIDYNKARGMLRYMNQDENVGWKRVAHAREWAEYRVGRHLETMFGTLMMGLDKLRGMLEPLVGWHNSVWESMLEDGGWKYVDDDS